MKKYLSSAAGIAVAAYLSSAHVFAATLTVLGVTPVPQTSPEGENITELSGLAWDEDEKLLYAVSDDGILHHFRIALKDDAVGGVESVFSTQLQPAGPSPLKNAEGLAVVNGNNGKAGDSALLIAFEDGPSVQRFTVQGKAIEALNLPSPLDDVSKYNEENSRLETVAVAPNLGILTAPEEPMSDKPGETHTIYAFDGKSWTFAAVQPKRSNLKAIEPLSNGRALVLERTREQKGGPDKARLRIVDLTGCAAETTCDVEDLDSDDRRLDDNFEGMARLSDRLYILVTDKKKRDKPGGNFLLVSVQ